MNPDQMLRFRFPLRFPEVQPSRFPCFAGLRRLLDRCRRLPHPAEDRLLWAEALQRGLPADVPAREGAGVHCRGRHPEPVPGLHSAHVPGPVLIYPGVCAHRMGPPISKCFCHFPLPRHSFPTVHEAMKMSAFPHPRSVA